MDFEIHFSSIGFFDWRIKNSSNSISTYLVKLLIAQRIYALISGDQTHILFKNGHYYIANCKFLIAKCKLEELKSTNSSNLQLEICNLHLEIILMIKMSNFLPFFVMFYDACNVYVGQALNTQEPEFSRFPSRVPARPARLHKL